MRVDLRGAQRTVAEHLLHDAQVRPALDHVRRGGVAQPVRRQVDPRRRRHRMDDPPGLARIEATAPGAEEKGRRVPARQQLASQAQPLLDRPRRGLAEGHGALLVAFAGHGERGARQVDVEKIQRAQLADADAGGIEDLDHRPVTGRDGQLLGGGPGFRALVRLVGIRGVGIRGVGISTAGITSGAAPLLPFEHGGRLIDGEDFRQVAVRAGAGDASGGVGVEQAGGHRPGSETADRRHRPGQRGARRPFAVAGAQVRANRADVEVGDDVEPRQQRHQVSAVGADRARGQPPDVFEVVEEVAEGGVKIRGEFPGKRRRRPPVVRAVRGPSGSRRRCLTHVAKPYPGEPGERRDP